MSPRANGWGFSTGVPRSRRPIVGALLCPLWFPIVFVLAVRVFGSGVLALGVLGALFIFMPGVLVIANYGSWPRWVRFVACMGYVGLAEAAYICTLYVAAQLTAAY